VQQLALEDDEVVRLRTHRVVGQQHHLLAGDVDELLVLRVQRANRQEAVLGELAAHGQELAVGGNGLDCDALRWPGWYCTSSRSTTYLAFLSPLWNLMAASTFHFTIWLSRNSVVKALPRPSNAVCSGPRPSSTSATMASSILASLPSNQSSTRETSITVAVGELAGADEVLLSGLAFTPCGFFGTDT
jgi:hypothetical protein